MTAVSILTPDGTLVKGAKPKVGDQLLLEMLRWMLMSRVYDERATALQRQGKYGSSLPRLARRRPSSDPPWRSIRRAIGSCPNTAS
jgi:hypothetical protein